jgi:hypothetical protein
MLGLACDANVPQQRHRRNFVAIRNAATSAIRAFSRQTKLTVHRMTRSTAPFTLAFHLAVIAVWAAKTTRRKPAYTPAELESALGCGMRALAQPLVVAGWCRVVVFSRRSGRPISRVLWVPPGQQVPKPVRGRPRFSFSNHIGVYES